MRDRVINNQSTYDSNEFMSYYTREICCNWPYRPMDVLVFHGGAPTFAGGSMAADEIGEVTISPVFEAHIRNQESWSIGPGFVQRYPELVGLCNVTAVRDNGVGGMAR